MSTMAKGYLKVGTEEFGLQLCVLSRMATSTASGRTYRQKMYYKMLELV
jgi:hypothetical protein